MLIASFGLLAVVYIVLTLLVSEHPTAAINKYHLTSSQLTVLSLTVIIPYLIIWALALFGYFRLKAYAERIKKSRDGLAFGDLARGLYWLALWMPLSSVTSALASYFAIHNPGLVANMIRLTNYMVVLLLFVSSYYLHRGASALREMVHARVHPFIERWLQLLGLALAAAYIYLIFHDPYYHHPPADSPTASSFLPAWLLLITLVLPRLITWYLAVKAVWNLYLYSQNIPGELYRGIVRRATWGLGVVVLMGITIRFIATLSTLNRAKLGSVLLLIYLLLAIMAAGYLLLAKGCKELADIEKV